MCILSISNPNRSSTKLIDCGSSNATVVVLETIATDFDIFGKSSYEQRLGLPGRVPLIIASVVHILMESYFGKILNKMTKVTLPDLEKEFQEKSKSDSAYLTKEYYDGLADGIREDFKKQFSEVLDSIEVYSDLSFSLIPTLSN